MPFHLEKHHGRVTIHPTTETQHHPTPRVKIRSNHNLKKNFWIPLSVSDGRCSLWRRQEEEQFPTSQPLKQKAHTRAPIPKQNTHPIQTPSSSSLTGAALKTQMNQHHHSTTATKREGKTHKTLSSSVDSLRSFLADFFAFLAGVAISSSSSSSVAAAAAGVALERPRFGVALGLTGVLRLADAVPAAAVVKMSASRFLILANF